MSLQSEPLEAIPAETVRIARAVYPKGCLAMRVRDILGGIYQDEQFAALYPRRGQPALAPWRLALVTLLQFVEGLTDRQAADAVRARIDWKYALGLELSDGGFDYSVLSEFRQRLVKGGAERLLLDRLLEVCQGQGWLKAGGRQRTDSTHVLAAIRALSDLEVVGETLRAALEELAVVAPDWLGQQITADWAERYGRRVENYRLPKPRSQRRALAEQIGRDGWQLLTALEQPSAPKQARELASVEVLRAVWQEAYEVRPAGVRWRDGPSIRSPYDAQARTGKKGQTEWQGYKVHVTETCETQEVHLITHVQTTLAPISDVEMTAPIQQALVHHRLAPSEHLLDSGYVDAQILVHSQHQGIEVIGPVGADTSWQAREAQGFDQAHFVIDWQRQQAQCPQGHRSHRWTPQQDPFGLAVIEVRFARTDCQPCPVRQHCTHAKRGVRSLLLRERDQYEALQARRAEQETPAFRTRYAPRAGVEATLSQGVRRLGMRRSRYLGLAKTDLQMQISAAALNVLRLDAMLTETKRGPTRRSHLLGVVDQVVNE